MTHRAEHLETLTPDNAAAVDATGRREIMLSAIATDLCRVDPARSLIAAADKLFVTVDASGSWTRALNDAALRRLMGENFAKAV